jgi:hypothetical protein
MAGFGEYFALHVTMNIGFNNKFMVYIAHSSELERNLAA